MSFFLSDLRLLGFGSHCFALPIFSKVGSNRSFTHDLNHEGRVVRFIEIEDDMLSSAYIAGLPNVKIDLGDFGLFTIVGDREILFQGNIDDLREHFLNHQYDDPVLELEAANLLGDRERMSIALEGFGWVRRGSPAAIQWAESEKRTFLALRKIRSGEKEQDTEQSSDLESDFDRLKAYPETDDWSRTWLSLWLQDFRRDALVKLACWRVDAGYDPQIDGALVYIRVLEGARDIEYAGNYCLRWLEMSPLGVVNWLKLAVSLWSRRAFQSDLNSLITEKLKSQLVSDDFAAPPWRRTWQFLWSRLGREHELEDLAKSYFDTIQRLSLSDGEVLLYLLRNPNNIGRFYIEAQDWLSAFPRGTLVWTDLFIAAFKYERSETLTAVGVDWLHTQGGTTNRWRVIWDLFEPLVTAAEHTEMGFDWLFRSRVDLQSWTQVFFVIAFRMPDSWHRERLVVIGEHWLSVRHRWHRDFAEMQKVTNHLRDSIVPD